MSTYTPETNLWIFTLYLGFSVPLFLCKEGFCHLGFGSHPLLYEFALASVPLGWQWCSCQSCPSGSGPTWRLGPPPITARQCHNRHGRQEGLTETRFPWSLEFGRAMRGTWSIVVFFFGTSKLNLAGIVPINDSVRSQAWIVYGRAHQQCSSTCNFITFALLLLYSITTSDKTGTFTTNRHHGIRGLYVCFANASWTRLDRDRYLISTFLFHYLPYDIKYYYWVLWLDGVSFPQFSSPNFLNAQVWGRIPGCDYMLSVIEIFEIHVDGCFNVMYYWQVLECDHWLQI